MSQPTTFGFPSFAESPNLSRSAAASSIKDSFAASLSSHRGASRPSYAVDGTVWQDSSTGLLYIADVTNGNDYLISVCVAVPAASNSSGVPGQCAYDSDYEYRCVAVDTWKRTPLSTW